MTESMIVEAVRAAGGTSAADQTIGAQAASPVADPSAVSRFEAAMATSAPQAASGVDPIPFASQASAAWRSAQVNNQGIIHRIRALSQLKREGNVAALDMMELQYEVMNLTFQQDVVMRVAEKSSNAIQTLIKNQ